MFRRLKKTTLQNSARGFYFKANQQRNIDFPLNIGYNDELIELDQMTLKSKASLFLKKQILSKQLAMKYVDLLNAIKNQNYEAIELLCEFNLT